MAEIQLFPREQVVGIFRGFRQGGMEFHADLVLPYRNEFQNIPMHGQFLQNMKNGTAPEAGRTRQLSATILEFDRQMPAGMSAHGASTIRSRS